MRCFRKSFGTHPMRNPMSLQLQPGRTSAGEEYRCAPRDDIGSDNPPRLKSGRTYRRHTVYRKPIPTWRRASTSRNSKGSSERSQVIGSRQCPGAGNQQQDVCHGHASKEVNDVRRHRRRRQWPKPCGAFAHTPSSALASLLAQLLRSNQIKSATSAPAKQ